MKLPSECCKLKKEHSGKVHGNCNGNDTNESKADAEGKVLVQKDFSNSQERVIQHGIKRNHVLYIDLWFILVSADHMTCVYVCVMESQPVFVCVYVFVSLFIRQLLSKALCAVITQAQETAGPFTVSGAAVSVQHH